MIKCIVFLAFIVVVYMKSEGSESFFVTCDGNFDKKLTLDEIEQCINKPEIAFNDLSIGVKTKADGLIKLLDRNGDRVISLEEYLVASKAKENHKYVTVKTKEGTEKEITYEELLENMEQHTKGMYMDEKSQTLMKDTLTTARVDELAKDSPNVNRFLKIGKFCHLFLQRNGYAHGKIVHLKSLPSGGSLNRGHESLSDALPVNGKFEIWLEMTVENGVPVSRTTYEIRVAHDLALYRKPFMAVLETYILDSTRERRLQKLSLPPPPYRGQYTDRFLRAINEILHRIYSKKEYELLMKYYRNFIRNYLSILLTLFLLFLVLLLWRHLKQKNRKID